MRKITNAELGRPSLEEFATQAKTPVVVVLDNVRSAQNVGSFFRTGDAFAIEHIALCGITATPPNREIHKTALGAEESVAWSHYPTTSECVEHLRNNIQNQVLPSHQAACPHIAYESFCIIQCLLQSTDTTLQRYRLTILIVYSCYYAPNVYLSI